MMLSSCAGINPVPVEDREVEARVRAPASQKSQGVQVFPLQNPAVKKLLADAGSAETEGNYTQAVALLERALRIQPRDPEILQQMAELQLQKQDYQQALNFAVRSYEIGPRVGEICDRNWRTISVAREHLGDQSGSRQAEQRASSCMNTKPRSL
jgi:tetratricopeptide (TPR) repeat protein